MTGYIKSYKFNGREYGIEDHQDGKPAKEHFFHDRYVSGQIKRFHLWVGGCGFGETDTLEEAEAKLFNYAFNETIYRKHKTEEALAGCIIELEWLKGLIG